MRKLRTPDPHHAPVMRTFKTKRMKNLIGARRGDGRHWWRILETSAYIVEEMPRDCPDHESLNGSPGKIVRHRCSRHEMYSMTGRVSSEDFKPPPGQGSRSGENIKR